MDTDVRFSIRILGVKTRYSFSFLDVLKATVRREMAGTFCEFAVA